MIHYGAIAAIYRLSHAQSLLTNQGQFESGALTYGCGRPLQFPNGRVCSAQMAAETDGIFENALAGARRCGNSAARLAPTSNAIRGGT